MIIFYHTKNYVINTLVVTLFMEKNNKSSLDGEIVKFMKFDLDFNGNGKLSQENNFDKYVMSGDVDDNTRLYAILGDNVISGFSTEYGVLKPNVLDNNMSFSTDILYILSENNSIVRVNSDKYSIGELEKEYNGSKYLVVSDVFQE